MGRQPAQLYLAGTMRGEEDDTTGREPKIPPGYGLREGLKQGSAYGYHVGACEHIPAGFFLRMGTGAGLLYVKEGVTSLDADIIHAHQGAFIYRERGSYKNGELAFILTAYRPCHRKAGIRTAIWFTGDSPDQGFDVGYGKGPLSPSLGFPEATKTSPVHPQKKPSPKRKPALCY
ncbi:hypothetical protein M3650_18945 [Paenibacillus sp. MER TA 81-3]|uniref:hypothetical protein n=1 Tax=Paenibacillus sp. MER TA 81-3 TaxID=2939573 RepID=UPI00203F0169|nr:hypothetical protein [Paenibacillus sp. MER TA 81-3]MCM3340650.1 hypothetical protein [Paenibacillus sp. MER TA 81-3]